MRYFKGCLTTLVLLVLILAGVFFLLKNNIINRLEVLSDNSSKSWTECSKTIEEKNLKLLGQNLQKDSLNYYLNLATKISLSKCSEELEFNEYKINQFLITEKKSLNIDDSLNKKIKVYNENARQYNLYRATFPNFLIARKENFPKNFTYFEYEYGVDNESIMVNKKKRKEWIKNGGQYPY